jgi:Ca-activated chloride channel family protein
MPQLPASIRNTLVVGVGDPRSGRYIDGHQSRQDASALRQLAGRLRGTYFDANEKHLPSETLRALAQSLPLRDTESKGVREAALTAVACGAALLAGLPVALARLGTPRGNRTRQTKLLPTGKTRNEALTKGKVAYA